MQLRSFLDDQKKCAVHALSKFTIGERTGIDGHSLTAVPITCSKEIR
jgi:hypothetical protein